MASIKTMCPRQRRRSSSSSLVAIDECKEMDLPELECSSSWSSLQCDSIDEDDDSSDDDDEWFRSTREGNHKSMDHAALYAFLFVVCSILIAARIGTTVGSHSVYDARSSNAVDTISDTNTITTETTTQTGDDNSLLSNKFIRMNSAQPIMMQYDTSVIGGTIRKRPGHEWQKRREQALTRKASDYMEKHRPRPMFRTSQSMFFDD